MIAIISIRAALWIEYLQTEKEFRMFFRVLGMTLATFGAVAASSLMAQHAEHSGHAAHVMADTGASGSPTAPGDCSFAPIL